MDLKQGDLENIILNALWDLEADGSQKIFVGDVQDRIRSQHKQWAYTTVKTVLDRLVDKDIAQREKEGKKYLYRSVVKRDEAGILAIQKVIRQYFRNDVEELASCLERLRHLDHSLEDAGKERQAALSQLEAMQKELVAR